MELELGGKTVLVTGGSDGLGRALCHRLVAEGVKVAFCGRDAGRLEATRAALEAEGGDVAAVAADVTRPDDIARFVETALERWGRIDGLVNNAGKSAAKPLADTTDEDFDGDLSLKLYAAARLCRLTLEHLAADVAAPSSTCSRSGGRPPGPAPCRRRCPGPPAWR